MSDYKNFLDSKNKPVYVRCFEDELDTPPDYVECDFEVFPLTHIYVRETLYEEARETAQSMQYQLIQMRQDLAMQIEINNELRASNDALRLKRDELEESVKDLKDELQDAYNRIDW